MRSRIWREHVGHAQLTRQAVEPGPDRSLRYAASMSRSTRTVARAIVECLENEGVEVVFGLPGEENLHVVDALADSSIRFITTRDERGAAFMADTYGALTGKPGVCLATLGPGAINLMLGIANAQLDSHPLVAITAQAGLDRIYKESHQFVDLVSLFRPITKWGDMVTVGGAAPEMVRKAFKQATTERPGATFLVLPEDVAERADRRALLPVNMPVDPAPGRGPGASRGRTCWPRRENPVVLAGPGVARDGATDALIRFSERLDVPVATTFLGKGVFPDDHPNALGTIGFMVKDYANFGFDRADVVVAVGYDLVEYSPAAGTRSATSGSCTCTAPSPRSTRTTRSRSGVQGDIGETLDAIGAASDVHGVEGESVPVRDLVARGAGARRGRRRVPAGAGTRRRRHPRGAGRRRHRAVRHRRREDVDGAPVPDVPAEHVL